MFTVKKVQPEEPTLLDKEIARLLGEIAKTNTTAPRATAHQGQLEDELTRLLSEMSNHNPDTKEYAEMATQFVKLHGLTSGESEYGDMVDQLAKLYKLKEFDTKKRVSPDTLAIIAGNLTGIVLVLGYERAGVITSRAFNLIGKFAR